MTRANLGGGGVHEVVVLSARWLLSLLEECNPDASNNDCATYSQAKMNVVSVRADIVGLALFKTILAERKRSPDLATQPQR